MSDEWWVMSDELKTWLLLAQLIGAGRAALDEFEQN